MVKRGTPPLPPDPFAEIKARFGPENLETILETYRRFADKVDYRKLVAWTMKDPVEDLLQPLFLAALVVITRELDLGAVAAELQDSRSAEAQQSELAESLAATARDLQAHIEARALELAEPQIRQLNAAVKSRDREFDELKRLRATMHRVRHQVRCWENEDGKWFAFRDDLYAALEGEVDPS